MRWISGWPLLAALLASPALAETATLPQGVFAGSRDYRTAPSGDYQLDASHTAVLAKVSHIGYGLSVFRFDEVQGTLVWSPDDPAKCRIEAHVKTASIATPVAGFSKELAGANYLNAGAFPEATFVSTGFERVDDTHARVDGTFTFLGHAKPMTIAVELQGAGKGFMGHPRLGVSAVGQMDPKAFGMNPLFSARSASRSTPNSRSNSASALTADRRPLAWLAAGAHFPRHRGGKVVPPDGRRSLEC